MVGEDEKINSEEMIFVQEYNEKFAQHYCVIVLKFMLYYLV